MTVLHVKGPSEAGPGERQEMEQAARQFLAQQGASDLVRIDVPGKGAGEEGEGGLRADVAPIVPALQSGSLFGEKQGVLVSDAENLQVAEAQVFADLLAVVDSGQVAVAVMSAGTVPAVLGKLLAAGETVTICKVRERDAAAWVGREARQRKLTIPDEAVKALIERFGSDLAALGSALDQLVSAGERINRDMILDRFRNRPDEPLWLYTDAIGKGDVSQALRRLGDFLTYGHPLQLVGALENEVRRLALASAAPDKETLAGWMGARSDRFVDRAWSRRGAVADSDLKRSLQALARADRTLKTAPEELHRVTMERLTTALCRWVGSRPRPRP